MSVDDPEHYGWDNATVLKLWAAGLLGTDPRADALVDRCTKLRRSVHSCTRRQVLDDHEWYRSSNYNVAGRALRIDDHLMGWHRIAGTRDVVGFTLQACWETGRTTPANRRSCSCSSKNWRTFRAG